MKNLVRTLLAASSLVAASSAFAGVDCTGDYFGFGFHLTAPTSGNQVKGPINVDVSQDGTVARSVQMTVTSSAIAPKASLALAGTDGQGATLTLNAAFKGGSYVGQMTIGSPSQGQATPDMTCTVN